MIAYVHSQYDKTASAFVGFWAIALQDNKFVGESVYLPCRPNRIYDSLRSVYIPAVDYLLSFRCDCTLVYKDQVLCTNAALVSDLVGDVVQLSFARRSGSVPPWVRTQRNLLAGVHVPGTICLSHARYMSFPDDLRDVYGAFLKSALIISRTSLYTESFTID